MSNKIVGVVLKSGIFLQGLTATDALDQIHELQSSAKLNGVAPSTDCNFVYDDDIEGFRFEAALGECGMTAESIVHQGEA